MYMHVCSPYISILNLWVLAMQLFTAVMKQKSYAHAWKKSPEKRRWQQGVLEEQLQVQQRLQLAV